MTNKEFIKELRKHEGEQKDNGNGKLGNAFEEVCNYFEEMWGE